MKKPLQLENLKPSTLDFKLIDLTYIFTTKPREKNLLHKIFQYFNQDVILATKLADKILQYENPNDLDKDRWTALHIAVRFNQIKAVKYAQKSGRFNFHQLAGIQEFSLMHIAVSKSNYEIIEILIEEKVSMFQENNEGILPRKLALQSPTNLKMIKKYENLQILRFLIDLEDIQEEDNINTNKIKNLNISQQNNINEANNVLITKQKVSMTYHLQSFNINFLDCEKFIENVLQKIFEGNDVII